MKRNFFKTLLLLAVFIMMFSACESNAPSQGSGTRTRDYCYITFTNTTSQYCAVIYLDGVPLNEIDDGWAWDGGWPLWGGKSNKFMMYDIKFPKDIKIELREISDETHYRTSIYKTYIKQGCSFNSNYDYKFMIREEGCTLNSVSVN